jgi:hypothetical protein
MIEGVAPTPAPVRMPAAYGITAVPGERLPWERVEEWLVAGRNYWICTTRADGRPHAKPVWGLWLDEAVLFSTAEDSVTGRNLAARPAVSIHLESGDEVAILEGEISFEGDRDLLARFADAYDEKYDFRPNVEGDDAFVYALRPREALSWTEADYPATATRWVFA